MSAARARFSGELRQAADAIWEAQHQHPFVRGIGDGTLPADRFRFYVRQDYVFLIDYARLLAMACARAPDLDTMRRFAELTQSTLGTELELHRGYASEWGIASAELDSERPAPSTAAYTDFLLRTAALGDFGELVAALLPCMWGYSEIALRLAQHGRPADPLYARWIDLYAGDDFAQLADWCREVCDAAAAGLGDDGRARMRAAFLASSSHELEFWESAWQSAAAR